MVDGTDEGVMGMHKWDYQDVPSMTQKGRQKAVQERLSACIGFLRLKKQSKVNALMRNFK